MMPRLLLVLTFIDLTVCVALGLPGLSTVFLGAFNTLSVSLGFGSVAVPTGLGAFFLNLAGLFGVGWNVAMLRARDPGIHRIDLALRAGVVALLCFHVFASALSPVIAIFAVTEVVGGVLKLSWLRSQTQSPVEPARRG